MHVRNRRQLEIVLGSAQKRYGIRKMGEVLDERTWRSKFMKVKVNVSVYCTEH
jgi:hypothetical protein